VTTSTSAPAGFDYGGSRVERLRRRASAVTTVTVVVVALLILAVQFTSLSGAWLLGGAVATLLLSMGVAAHAR
jgi:hypothetical protein